ncbi:helix-turn-helix transcriptional regulator [Marinifilum sp.]|uniref:helix-turn-helix transcriptional regulator n=1 Tax=Marinifilum sp. TaxID=2033137 RepID=UPI003BA85660
MRKKSIPDFRHQVIDSCLCNKCNKWTKEKLIERINEKLYDQLGIEGISESTFYSDLKTMRSEWPKGHDAPIECVNGAYIYTDPNFTIQKGNLKDEDIESINKAIEVLSQFKQLGIHHELSSVKEKILGYNSSVEEEHLIEFEQISVKGTEFISILYPLLKEKRVIKIKYHPFKYDEPKEFIVHPYYLKQYKHRWYLVSFCETHMEIATYALDRFVNITEMPDIKFREEDYTRLKNRFKNIIGVTKISDLEPLEIKIWVAKKLLPYLLTKQIHRSQKIIKQNTQGATLKLLLIPNYEFYSTILGFGEDIKILSPHSIVDNMEEKLHKLIEQYEH